MAYSRHPVPVYERHKGDWFEAELPKSASWENRVATWLSGRGWTVTKAPRELRPSADAWRSYSMPYDLTISKNNQPPLLVEVKHRERLDFTGSDDFPFPDLITYEVGRWARSDARPDITIILNRSGTHAAAIDTSTTPFWTKRKKWDSRKGRNIEFYYCPLKHVVFYSLEDN